MTEPRRDILLGNPSLAVTAPVTSDGVINYDRIVYPLGHQTKIDGVCGLGGDQFFSRRLKAFENRAVQIKWKNALEQYPLLAGLHGEVIVETDGVFDPAGQLDHTGKALCNRTAGLLSTHEGHDRIEWHLFDTQKMGNACYEARHAALTSMKARKELPDWVKVIPLTIATTKAELMSLVRRSARLGFEGSVGKSLDTPYKFGRATQSKGQLMRFTSQASDEAVIVGAVEEEANENCAVTNALGNTERSTHKAGLVKTGTLGALKVRGIRTKRDSMWVDTEFNVGTGFDAKEKARLWALHLAGELEGQVITYHHKPHGATEKPRFAAYKGIRPRVDL